MDEKSVADTTESEPQEQPAPDSSNEEVPRVVASPEETSEENQGEVEETMADSTDPDPLASASAALEREIEGLPHSTQGAIVSEQPSPPSGSADVPDSNQDPREIETDEPKKVKSVSEEKEGEGVVSASSSLDTQDVEESSEAVTQQLAVSSSNEPDSDLCPELSEEKRSQSSQETEAPDNSHRTDPPELERQSLAKSHESGPVESSQVTSGEIQEEDINTDGADSDSTPVTSQEIPEDSEDTVNKEAPDNEDAISQQAQEGIDETCRTNVETMNEEKQHKTEQKETEIPAASDVAREESSSTNVTQSEKSSDSKSDTDKNDSDSRQQNATVDAMDASAGGSSLGDNSMVVEDGVPEKSMTDDEIEFVAAVRAEPEPVPMPAKAASPQVPPIRLKLVNNSSDGVSRFSAHPATASPPSRHSAPVPSVRTQPLPAENMGSALSLSRKGRGGIGKDGGRDGAKEEDLGLLALLTSRPSSPPPFRFSPPPSHLNIPIPVGGYPCNDCGNVYAMKSLREFHLERKVMRIQVYCLLCCTNNIFYNRCRYLEHIRSHAKERSNYPGGVFKDVKIAAFTTDELDKAFEDWWSCPAIRRISDLCTLYEYEFGTKISIRPDESEAEPVAEPPKLSAALKVPEPPKVDKPLEKLPPSKPYTNCHCSECGQEFGSPEELKRHFVYNLPPNQKQYICQTCSAVYFSPCGNLAHKRVHRAKEEQRNPFTCAECGALQKSSKELSAHLASHRTAPTILNAWRCPKCFTFYSNWTTLVVHTASAHSSQFYKCTRCSQAIQGMEAYENHLRSRHNSTAKADGAQPLLKCPQCDCMHNSKDELVEHVKTHYGNLAPFKVFRCPMCGRLLENKQGLVSHLGRSHNTFMKANDILEFPFKIPDAAPSVSATTSPAPAPPALKRPILEEPVASPPKKKSGGIEPQKEYASVPAPPTRGPTAAASRGGTMSRLPGTGPGTLLPSLPPGLSVDGSIRCPYCPPDKDPLPNEFMMRLHLKVKHPEKAAELSADAQKKKTGSSNSKISPESKTTGKVGNSPGTYVCPKCSTIFHSENSIKRHFLAAHRISDFEGYFMSNRDQILQRPSTEGLLKCSVCKEGFPSQAELDVHSKQHGLHFLQKSLHTNP